MYTENLFREQMHRVSVPRTYMNGPEYLSMNSDKAILSIVLDPSFKTTWLQSSGCYLLSSITAMSVMALTSSRQRFPPGTPFKMFCSKQPVVDQLLVRLWAAANLLWGHLRILFGHCGPTVGADGHPLNNVDCRGRPKRGFGEVSPSRDFCWGLWTPDFA